MCLKGSTSLCIRKTSDALSARYTIIVIQPAILHCVWNVGNQWQLFVTSYSYSKLKPVSSFMEYTENYPPVWFVAGHSFSSELFMSLLVCFSSIISGSNERCVLLQYFNCRHVGSTALSYAGGPHSKKTRHCGNKQECKQLTIIQSCDSKSNNQNKNVINKSKVVAIVMRVSDYVCLCTFYVACCSIPWLHVPVNVSRCKHNRSNKQTGIVLWLV